MTDAASVRGDPWVTVVAEAASEVVVVAAIALTSIGSMLEVEEENTPEPE